MFKKMMSRAIYLASKAQNPAPNPKVGCVIVRNGQIVGEGFHENAGDAHAEVIALKKAGKKAEGSTLFVTLEPCNHHGKTPPCSQAILKAGIKKVVIGMSDPNPEAAGGTKFLEKHRVETKIGVCEKECAAINQAWLKNMRLKLPYLTLKLALDKDGSSVPPKGRKWITGESSRRQVMRLRAEHEAIAVGVNTVITDNPRLNVRKLKVQRQPVRVIFDPNSRTPRDARILEKNGGVIIVSKKPIRISGAKNLVVKNYNLKTILKKLYELNIRSIFLEGGEFTACKFLDANLIDRALIFQNKSTSAPKVCGKKLPLKKIRTFGNDTLFEAVLKDYS